MFKTKILKTFCTQALITLSIAGLGLAISGAASARAISFASSTPPTNTSYNRVLKWWSDELEKRSDGELSLNIHYMGSLVKLKDAVDGVSSGVADAGYVIPAYSQARMPLHYLSTTGVGTGDQYVAMEAWRRMYDRFPELKEELDRNNMVYLSHYSIGPSVLLSKNRPYYTPDDLKGDKIRLASRWARAAEQGGWNVATVNLTFPDIYTALERGTIDGAQSYLNLVIPYRHHEIANYVIEPNLGQQTNIVVMNKRVYENLSEKSKKALKSLQDELLLREAREDLIDSKNSRDELTNDKKYPTKVIRLNAEQRRSWAKAVSQADEDVVGRLAKRNPAAPKIYKAYMAEIDKVEKEVEENGYPWDRK
ncbi:TRAP transporter substrate-binding protein DctP [Alloalcanivorax mobilis]|uniref:TRAP transporter substrate-binding protein DctP n=1 Tax=Alloalcanivorax mobilis TaxID=2019569 RepID=UPI000C762226|nr:TRAP transporter substrate-binding protein DctP [Alloalcanivorax mobilis]